MRRGRWCVGCRPTTRRPSSGPIEAAPHISERLLRVGGFGRLERLRRRVQSAVANQRQDVLACRLNLLLTCYLFPGALSSVLTRLDGCAEFGMSGIERQRFGEDGNRLVVRS